MKKVIVLLFVLLFAFSYVNAEETGEVSATAEEVKTTDVVATVNGVDITLTDLDGEIAGLPEKYRQAVSANKEKFLDELILRELMYQKAEALGLSKNEEILKVLDSFKRRLMVQKLAEDIISVIEVSDEDAKKYYEENKDEFKVPEQVNAAHILIKVDSVDDEEESKKAQKDAEDILKRIKGGEEFSELAKENSACPSSAKGGDLGYFTKGQMVPEFEEAVFSLKPGEISEIVKTKFGYHIIKLLDKKEETTRTFDEAKESIINKLRAEEQKKALMDYTETVKQNAKITINEELLK